MFISISLATRSLHWNQPSKFHVYQPSVRTVNYLIHWNTDNIKSLPQTQLWLPAYSRDLPFTIRVKAASVSIPAALSLSPSTFHFFLLILPSLSCDSCSKWPWHVLFPKCIGVLLFHSCQVTSGLLAATRTSYLTLSLGFKGKISWKAALLKHNYIDILQHSQCKPKLQSRCQNH